MPSCEGQQLIAVGTAIAFQIAQHASTDDMVLLGSLFNVIGEQLDLLAITKEREERCRLACEKSRSSEQ
ncbi:MAG: hypothetical protein HFJ84_05925 [Clostridiales bacterium]|jgi:hypothetical protein|nr:hypothetical protein [Clostridiales bacterium]